MEKGAVIIQRKTYRNQIYARYFIIHPMIKVLAVALYVNLTCFSTVVLNSINSFYIYIFILLFSPLLYFISVFCCCHNFNPNNFKTCNNNSKTTITLEHYLTYLYIIFNGLPIIFIIYNVQLHPFLYVHQFNNLVTMTMEFFLFILILYCNTLLTYTIHIYIVIFFLLIIKTWNTTSTTSCCILTTIILLTVIVERIKITSYSPLQPRSTTTFFFYCSQNCSSYNPWDTFCW